MSLTETVLNETQPGWDCDERDWWRDGQPLTEGFDGAVLRVVLPTPPPDNLCAASSGVVRYPTARYKDFLNTAGPHLRFVLGDCQPDCAHWWRVWVRVWLPGHQGDVQNLVKPLLDLLSGTRLGERGEKNARGTSMAGRIVKHGLLWDDDRRVELREVRLMAVQAQEPRVELVAAWGGTPPVNEVKAARETAKQARVAEREARRQEAAESAGRKRGGDE